VCAPWSRSAAITSFFKAELLAVNKAPDGPIIHLQPAVAKSTQGEISFLDPVQHPNPMFARDRPWSVTTHFARRDAAGLAQAPHPVNGGADATPKLLRGSMHSQMLKGA
jgi:hypothetical protein